MSNAEGDFEQATPRLDARRGRAAFATSEKKGKRRARFQLLGRRVGSVRRQAKLFGILPKSKAASGLKNPSPFGRLSRVGRLR
jgi:hypothetical protein